MDQQEDIKIIELTTRMQHYKKLNETASNLLGAIKDSDDPQTRIDLYNVLQDTEEEVSKTRQLLVDHLLFVLKYVIS